MVKLAQGTHSTDVCLTDCAELVVRYREGPGGDRVVQKYITKPVLFKGRKMDLRVSALLLHLNLMSICVPHCVCSALMASSFEIASSNVLSCFWPDHRLVDHRMQAQVYKLVLMPLILGQVYLIVRSFAEADAYLYRQWYARVANKEYGSDISATQNDFERHFTVACYNDDPAVSGAQVPSPLLYCALLHLYVPI